MIHLTIGDLIDGNTDHLDTDGHHLYVVRDGDVTFYVGKSRSPITRLRGHLGLRDGWGFGDISTLARFVECNMPDSRTWQIELLALADVGERWAGRGEHWIDSAEATLIDRYVPHCNSLGKRQPSVPLPERYKTPWPVIANAGVRLE